ncbi:hypothetical protein H4R34_004411 [Dimargaris verticillata]|uniref:sphingolipid C(9)-methyltransferase n=1 Tax=Dimargaris verticillata TaxID=2761393 RepID=A0A9W8B4Y7_9FUNG|nr:hypothetical protein H4R34_004411 [Dimargaris verticillata]
MAEMSNDPLWQGLWDTGVDWWSMAVRQASPPTFAITLVLVLLCGYYITQYWHKPSHNPAALHLVPTSSSYPRTVYTTPRKIPFYLFLHDFLTNRVELRGRDGTGLNHIGDFIYFPLSLRSVWTFAVRVLPRWLWHSKSRDAKDWCRYHDGRDDLFDAFLGRERMTWTAHFGQVDWPLTRAQEACLDLIAQRLVETDHDDHILNIGLGWGTYELYMGSNHMAFFTSTSLSAEQAKYSQEMFERANLDNRVAIRRDDFRDLKAMAQFTKIVSLETPDWVGQKNLAEFFQKCYALLKPGGRMLFQCTTSPSPFASAFSDYFSEPFHYHLYTLTNICPGRDTPLFTTLNDYVHEIKQAGFDIVTIDNISNDAALTHAHWFQLWEQHKRDIELKFGEYLYRQWELYFAWSSSIFKRGKISRYTIVIQKSSA